MKKKFPLLFTAIIFVLFVCACSKGSSMNNSKVLATVGEVEITQQQIAAEKADNILSTQGKNLSDRELLDKLINEQLFLFKAKELNIKMSDKDVKNAYKEMKQSISYTESTYVEGEEEKLDKNTIERLRRFFTVEKTKAALGSNIGEALKELSETVKIKYYN